MAILSNQGCDDLTDERCPALAPLVAAPSSNGVRLTDMNRRVIVNAVRCNHRTGRQWCMRPNDVPPMSSVCSSFDPWNRDGTCIAINDTLRKPARQALNRDPEPSISVLGFQSVTTTEPGGKRGCDKKGQ